MKKKLKKKGFYFSIAFFFLIAPNLLFSAPPSCPWTDELDPSRSENLTPRTLPEPDANGNVQYESCEKTRRDKQHQVNQARANRNANQNITGGGPKDCYYKEPLPPFTQHKLEVKEIDRDQDGNPIYEPCNQAQWRAQEEWRKKEGWQNRSDLEAEIARQQEKLAQEAQSASEASQRASEKQDKASTIATAGAMAAGAAAAICCSKSPACSACPYLVALSAGLGIAGMALGMASSDNADISSEYAGGLIPDPNGGGGGSSTTHSTGGPVATTTTGPGTPPPLTPPPVNIPGTNDRVVPLPRNLGPYLKGKGLAWDPSKRKITLPNGKSYTADDINKPGIQKLSNSGPAKALKAQMKALENKMGGSDGLAGGGGEEETAEEGLGGGGKGFSGYGGGADSGSAGGQLMAGHFGRKPGSDKKGGTKMAGMSVKMGKDNVGVKQDNIFDMIHRRYQAKRKNRNFIELF